MGTGHVLGTLHTLKPFTPQHTASTRDGAPGKRSQVLQAKRGSWVGLGFKPTKSKGQLFPFNTVVLTLKCAVEFLGYSFKA